MTVLRECVLVSELEERLYKGAIRKCRSYEGKIITSGGKSYIRLSDLLPKHADAAEGVDVIDRAVPLSSFVHDVPGISHQDAIREIGRSRRAIMDGRIVRRRHGVYVRVDEDTASMLERMTAFAIRSIDDIKLATKRALIGNVVIGFY